MEGESSSSQKNQLYDRFFGLWESLRATFLAVCDFVPDNCAGRRLGYVGCSNLIDQGQDSLNSHLLSI